jgi:hypothetical protein
MQNFPLLSVGKDPLLLSTRNEVLRAAGFDVISCSSVKEALLAMSSGPLCAVVLCHSVPPGERDQIRAMLSRLQPTVSAMVVCCGDYDARYDELLVENDPRVLVSTVTASAKAIGLH